MNAPFDSHGHHRLIDRPDVIGLQHAVALGHSEAALGMALLNISMADMVQGKIWLGAPRLTAAVRQLRQAADRLDLASRRWPASK